MQRVSEGKLLTKLLSSPKPKEELVSELTRIINLSCKKLNITWNSKVFAKGLLNPELPKELLRRLEDFIEVGERLNWELPPTLREEFSALIEDIESFNPAFIESLQTSKRGKRVSSSKIEKRLGV